ncbi:MAG: glycosyltransferase family 2 protein [Lachnospiraceae bacterium]|nr:glycosyltransferase family 2 protein [Lachnospiraceae bacterium]
MIDILLATYNGEQYLEELLSSVKGQNYRDWRLIARDDGSTDHTVKLLKAFRDALPQGKVLVYENDVPTGSAKANFLKLIADADSDYVMFCDQDDVWKRDKIRRTFNAMREAEKGTEGLPVLVHTDLDIADENLTVMGKSFLKHMKLPTELSNPERLIQNNVTGCTMMINRPLLDLLKKAVRGGEHIVMHDHFAAIIAGLTGKVVCLAEPTIFYRQHGINSVGAKSTASDLSVIKDRAKKGREAFQEDLNRYIEQAKYILYLYRDDIEENQDKRILRTFSRLDRMSKLQKVRFCKKSGVLKKGFIKKRMQLIWM